jgi:fumarylacetoacetate (FAA) hydrolase family protein
MLIKRKSSLEPIEILVNKTVASNIKQVAPTVQELLGSEFKQKSSLDPIHIFQNRTVASSTDKVAPTVQELLDVELKCDVVTD